MGLAEVKEIKVHERGGGGGPPRSFIYSVTGENQCKPAWYIVDVFPEKIFLFNHQVKTDFIDLSDYGTVLECGWGEETPREILDKYMR